MLTATIALPTATARVLRIVGEEALGQGFRYEVDAAFTTAPASAAVIGAAALLILREDGAGTPAEHPLSAVVTACTDLGAVGLPDGSAPALWRLRLEPALARWEQDRGNAVLAGRNPVDAACEAIAAALAGTNARCSRAFIAQPHFVRQQVVRFQESTAAFATRLLEEEGIHSFYIHQAAGQGSHVLVLAEENVNTSQEGGDGAGLSNPAASVDPATPYRRLWHWRTATADLADGFAVADRHAARSGAAADQLADRLGCARALADAQRAAAGLPAAGTAARTDLLSPAGGALVGDWPDQDPAATAGTTPLTVGEAGAGRREDEALCRARRHQGRGDHLGLGAGTVLTRDGERTLVVVRRLRLLPDLVPAQAAEPVDRSLAALAGQQADALRHAAELPALERFTALAEAARGSAGQGLLSWDGQALWAEVETVPVGLRYRPPRTRPAPVLAGGHLATVASADGAGAGAVRTDALGRVQLQFDWAPAGQLSGWLPVAQGARGLLAVPRVGERVAVLFAYGDPGRPLVAGLVADQAADLPGDPSAAEVGRTVIGGAFTAAGGYGPAIPNLARKGDLTVVEQTVDRDGTPTVVTDLETALTGGTAARTYASSYLAFEDQWAAKDKDGKDVNRSGVDLFTSGSMREQVNGNRTINVGGALTINAGSKLVLRVGDATLTLTPSGVTLNLANPTFPALGPTVALNVTGVSLVGPLVEATGYLRARMASSGSAFTAQGPYAKVNGFSSSLNSDLVGCEIDMLSAWTSVFVSAATKDKTDSRSLHWKNAENTFFIVKESCLAATDLAKVAAKSVAIGVMKSPLDLIGSGLVDATAGTATVRTSPFGSLTTAGIFAGIFKISGYAIKLAQSATPNQKDDTSSIEKLTYGSAATGVTMLSALMEGISYFLPPSLNKVAVGAVSGVEIRATGQSTISLSADQTALNSEVTAAKARRDTIAQQEATASSRVTNLERRGTYTLYQEEVLSEARSALSAKRSELTAENQRVQAKEAAVAAATQAASLSLKGALVQAGA
ncbi:MAG: phage baseplate assembly protein V [Planctomycetes bacterium]|nr:phage baseplate assembly protein V [Planctomycetota bacterium]